MSANDASYAAQLEVLLETALDLSGSEREQFLSGPCVAPELREALEALLVAATSSGPLDRTPGHLASMVLAENSAVSSLASDRRLGRYRLVRLLGEGGMASVWLAERDSGDFQHQVAIKCLKTGMLTRDGRSRFLREQHILAQLQHVHIGRLFDAGISDEGMPFLVMEYVDGLPLLRHCDEHRLDVKERLRLFQKLCSAVAYAHQNLIVHRDIKPSNIMVDARGEPRLLDFGIAKLLDSGDEPITRTGSRLLTPEYAAPEQINDQPITTATDVYGLGAVLYELLTGVRARSAGKSGVGATQSVPRPSDVLRRNDRSPAGISRTEIRGDLDIVVLKALHEEPARRYASAQGLGDDIERYVTQQPIVARKDTGLYRVSKFIRRHRFGVAAGMAVMASLVGASIISARQAAIARDEAIRATTESARANKERQRALAARDFLIGLFEITEKSGLPHDKIPTADVLLEEGAKKILNEFTDAPELKLDLMLTLARMQFNYGNTASAEQLVKESLAISDAVLSPKEEQWLETRRGWAGILMRKPGQSAEAVEFLADAIKQHRQAGARDNATLGEALRMLGFLYFSVGQPVTAVGAAHDGLEVTRRSSGVSQKQLQQALHRYLGLLNMTNHWAEAGSIVDENLRLAEQLYGKQHQEYANAAILKAEYLNGALRRFDEAEKMAREATAVLEKIFSKPTAEMTLALDLLGNVLVKKGKYDEAAAIFERLLQLGEQFGGPYDVSLSSAAYALGNIAVSRGDLSGAERFYRRALDSRQRGGDQPGMISVIQNGLARALYKQNRYAEAVAVLRDGIEGARRFQGPESLGVAVLSTNLAGFMAEQGDVQGSEVWLEQALSIFIHDPSLGIHHFSDAVSLKCNILNDKKHYTEAKALSALHIAYLRYLWFTETPDFYRLSFAWDCLGMAQQGLGQIDEAAVSFINAKTAMQKSPRFDLAKIKNIEKKLKRLHSLSRSDASKAARSRL